MGAVSEKGNNKMIMNLINKLHILESFVHIYRHDPPSAGQLQVHNYIHNVYICEMIVYTCIF